MSVSKEAWVEILAKKQLMWHGTLAKNLRSILKEGLRASLSKNPNFRWNPDEYEFSYATHGGVYLADNLNSAWSTAKGSLSRLPFTHSKDILLVGVQIETTSPQTLLDEDDLTGAFQRVFSDIYTWGVFVKKYSGPLDAVDSMDWDALEKWVEALDVSPFVKALNIPNLVRNKHKGTDEGLEWLEKSPRLNEAIEAATRSFIRYMTFSWFNASTHRPNTPKFYRRFADDLATLSKVLKKLADSTASLRQSENIGYRGANRIVFVGLYNPKDSGKVIYSTSPMAEKMFQDKAAEEQDIKQRALRW